MIVGGHAWVVTPTSSPTFLLVAGPRGPGPSPRHSGVKPPCLPWGLSPESALNLAPILPGSWGSPRPSLWWLLHSWAVSGPHSLTPSPPSLGASAPHSPALSLLSRGTLGPHSLLPPSPHRGLSDPRSPALSPSSRGASGLGLSSRCPGLAGPCSGPGAFSLSPGPLPAFLGPASRGVRPLSPRRFLVKSSCRDISSCSVLTWTTKVSFSWDPGSGKGPGSVGSRGLLGRVARGSPWQRDLFLLGRPPPGKTPSGGERGLGLVATVPWLGDSRGGA